MSSAADSDLRARLAAAKLRSLARDHFGIGSPAGEVALASGAALHDGSTGVVLAGLPAVRVLGQALAWAERAVGGGALHVLLDDPIDAGVVARRARQFQGHISVWQVVDRDLTAAPPSEHLPVADPDPAALACLEPLVARGAEVVVEHGIPLAEIDGLEVGRAVRRPDGEWVLEVGVGKFDREAASVMESVRSREEITDSVVAVVRRHRQRSVTPHLLNRLGRQRWLRAKVLAEPEIVGATALAPLEPPLPRANLVDAGPALAWGTAASGGRVVVACSVGVDLDLVPTAADARARVDPDAELVVVTPPRDQYPVLRSLADRLHRPARLVAVDGDWPS